MSRRAGKQRERDGDDAGMSTAGKVALGVAAAAAGAAIGYIGGRLLSSWLSEPASDEKPKKCDASKEDDSKYGDAVNDKNASHTPRHTAPHVNANLSVIQPQLSLHEHLFQYYHEYVDIPDDDLQAVQRATDHVTRAVRSQLRESSSFKSSAFKIGDLASFGSMTEGLQVIRPEYIDVMIPVMFGLQCRAEEVQYRDRKVAGNLVIVANDDTGVCGDICDEEQRVITRKLVELLQKVIEKAVQVVTGYHCVIQPLLSHSATAISLAVYTNDHHPISLNFFPFIIIDNHLFYPVADPPCSTEEHSGTEGRLWTEAFVRQEKWSIDRFDSSVCGHVVVLKILKAIRLNHCKEFGAISSYHLKMILFHLLEDLPDSSDWDMSVISERLIDLLTKLTDVLSEHSMPHYFNPSVNMLEDVPHEMCTNLAKFIGKKLAHNDIASLLKRSY